MKILIVGAGSIGVYLGTVLGGAGHEVLLLGRKKLKKLHETILIGETIYSMPKRIYTFPKNQSFDFVFITSKLYDLVENLKKLRKNAVQTKYLLSIQNGIVENELFEDYVQGINFSSISVFEGFRIIENQLIINPSSTGWKIDSSLTGKKTAKLLQEAGINCSTERDLDSIKAEKTIMNCSVNLLSAIEKKTFFELYSNTKTKNLMDNLFDESYDVLSKEYAIRPKAELKRLFYTIIKNMKHYSSTYQDVVSGRRTEVQFLNGLIMKLAKKHKFKVKTTEDLLNKFYNLYPKYSF